MKKLFILFSLILFTLSFSEGTYKVSFEKGVKISSAETSQNNAQIENLISSVFGPDTYSLTNIRKMLGFSGSATKEEEALASSASVLLQNFLESSKFTLNEIHYVNSDTADLSITTVTPDVESYISSNEPAIEKRAEQYFKEISGKTVQQVDRDTANQDKYVPVLMAAYLSSVSENIKNIQKTNTNKSDIRVQKVNGVWILNEKILDELIYSPLF